MFRKPQIPLFDFIASVSRTMDLMDSTLVSHNLRVAYIGLRIAEDIGLSLERRKNVLWAGALHDIGAFYFSERRQLLRFEHEAPHQHAEAGYLMLRIFEPFDEIARIIRFHHVPWADGAGETFRGLPVPIESHILHLADRIAVLIPPDLIVPRQADKVRERIAQRVGKQFVPELAAAFERLAEKEYFWLETLSAALEAILRRALPTAWVDLDGEMLTQFAYLLCRLIDFKSQFTATHSSGVAAAAAALAQKIGFSNAEQQTMRIAAYLHDLGKLAVPAEILEKPGGLSERERDVMMGHVYFTYEILSRIDGFDTITAWSALHQERMDGSGYPFHFTAKDLPLGARVMAVADVFTALTENRPYRIGMPKEQATRSLSQLAKGGALDARVVNELIEHFDEINRLREEAQREAERQYEEFARALDNPDLSPPASPIDPSGTCDG